MTFNELKDFHGEKYKNISISDPELETHCAAIMCLGRVEAELTRMREIGGDWVPGLKCETCKGTGEQDDTPRCCPDCAGTGDVWMTWKDRAIKAEKELAAEREKSKRLAGALTRARPFVPVNAVMLDKIRTHARDESYLLPHIDEQLRDQK